jgi:hypothetical protein
MNNEEMQNFKQTTLKPQDIVVSLKRHLEKRDPTIQTLAKALYISAGEVHGALKRAEKSRLLISESGKKKLATTAFVEFIIHGLKYVFPASTGSIVRGMPTGIAAIEGLKRQFAPTDALPFVWPHPKGTISGIALAPLFPSVPQAAAEDPHLYKALALVDAIREGAARERELAVQEIRIMLLI